MTLGALADVPWKEALHMAELLGVQARPGDPLSLGSALGCTLHLTPGAQEQAFECFSSSVAMFSLGRYVFPFV